jgi:hypothetical protein
MSLIWCSLITIDTANARALKNTAPLRSRRAYPELGVYHPDMKNVSQKTSASCGQNPVSRRSHAALSTFWSDAGERMMG